MIILSKITDEDSKPYTLTREVRMTLDDNEATLNEMLTAYEDFMRGIGFNFDGHIVIDSRFGCA